MSSNILKAMQNLRKNLHNVGSLNNWNKTVLNQGAIATEKMDNFTLAKIGFNAGGERIATPIANDGEKGVLVASVEDYMKEYETISSFFNGQGERVRVVALEPGVRFECSNFETDQADLGTHPIKNGQKVHYNQATHKFMISNNNGGVDHGGYGAAANKLVVVDCNCVSLDGQEIIRFEVVQ